MSGEGVRPAEELPLPGGDFTLFVTRLAVQGLFALGRLENPLTGQAQVNLDQARMLRDDLRMLLEKTEGNLDSGEEAHLRKVLGDLEHGLEED